MSKVWIDETEPAPPECLWCKTYDDAKCIIPVKNLFDGCIGSLLLSADALGYEVAKLAVNIHAIIGNFQIHGADPNYAALIRQIMSNAGYIEYVPYKAAALFRSI